MTIEGERDRERDVTLLYGNAFDWKTIFAFIITN